MGGCSGVFGGNLFCNAGGAAGWRAGWTVGGGIEAMLARNWSAKAEYLYYDLGRTSYTDLATAPFAAGIPVMQTSVSFAGSIARVGLNYQFH